MVTPCVPLIHASNLAELAAYYRRVLTFDLIQQIPGVFALVGLDSMRLQLWQRPGLMARSCVIDLDNGSVFDLHARLARLARSAIVEDGPALRAWGAWEFTLCDCQGSRVVFRKWAAPCGSTGQPSAGAQHRGAEP